MTKNIKYKIIDLINKLKNTTNKKLTYINHLVKSGISHIEISKRNEYINYSDIQKNISNKLDYYEKNYNLEYLEVLNHPIK